MTEKENYFKVMNGEQPEWLPHFAFGGRGGKTPTAMVSPRIFATQHTPGVVSKDCWGVTYVPADSVAGAKIPKPNDFILRDIRDWREVIKLPDLSQFDFEAEAKEQLAKIDRNETAVIYDLNGGVFQLLMSFMGFNEGLLAMFEEPEEVTALLEYCSNFIYEVNEKCVDLYQPDVFALVDDTATWMNPFISLPMYREMIKPFHAQQTQFAKDRGCYVDMHDCGRCEDFIEDWFDLGVRSWNPAQTCNDLVGIKKRYGNELVMEGCWTPQGELLKPDASEQLVKDSLKRTIDTFAPGGGYMYSAHFLGSINDPIAERKNRWVQEVYDDYGRDFYKK